MRGSTIQRCNASQQPRVAPVAERRVLRVLAATPRDGFSLGNFCFQGHEARALVRAVAKRLAPGPAARAPEISAGFNFLGERRFLGNCRFHNAATIIALRKNATPLGVDDLSDDDPRCLASARLITWVLQSAALHIRQRKQRAGVAVHTDAAQFCAGNIRERNAVRAIAGDV